MKVGTYVINLVKFKSIGAHWLALCLNGDKVTFFIVLEFNTFQKKTKKIIGNKHITNVYIIL